MHIKFFLFLLLIAFTLPIFCANNSSDVEIVTFPSGKLILHGVIYKPKGSGPFPAVLYNHGSSPGMISKEASDKLGPFYARHGWVFFMPYRRGQGLSESASEYIMEQVKEVRKKGGDAAGAKMITRLLTTDHLNDQLAALAWLKKQPFVNTKHIAVAGNSFGGIETVLGTAKGTYCAGIDASGGAQSWNDVPEIQTIMVEAIRNSKCPLFFFQAANDYNLTPTHVLSRVMKETHKPYKAVIYPPFGKTAEEGHSFAYVGASIWGREVMQFLNQYCAN